MIDKRALLYSLVGCCTIKMLLATTTLMSLRASLVATTIAFFHLSFYSNFKHQKRGERRSRRYTTRDRRRVRRVAPTIGGNGNRRSGGRRHRFLIQAARWRRPNRGASERDCDRILRAFRSCRTLDCARKCKRIEATRCESSAACS